MAHELSVEFDVRRLQSLGIDELRQIWRVQLGEDPPPLRAPELLRRELSSRLEARIHGDIDPRLKQRLDRLAQQVGRKGARPSELIQPAIGAVMTREWDGVAYSITVLERGFLFEGETHRSLSAIARRITGVRWSGPRFFGLTEARSK